VIAIWRCKTFQIGTNPWMLTSMASNTRGLVVL
jgi:hypothetical protein